MKDFVKWLGVNEKIAKIVVWIVLIMILLVITNTMLESVGFPNYKITYENLKQIRTMIYIEYIINWVTGILEFLSITLLVFRLKRIKGLFKYSIPYIIINVIAYHFLPYHIVQVFIILHIMVFCYIYSSKKARYIFYGLFACIFNILLQYVWYFAKLRFIDYSQMSEATKSLLALDYYIIVFIIILVKEIYLNKRGEQYVEKT